MCSLDKRHSRQFVRYSEIFNTSLELHLGIVPVAQIPRRKYTLHFISDSFLFIGRHLTITFTFSAMMLVIERSPRPRLVNNQSKMSTIFTLSIKLLYACAYRLPSFH